MAVADGVCEPVAGGVGGGVGVALALAPALTEGVGVAERDGVTLGVAVGVPGHEIRRSVCASLAYILAPAGSDASARGQYCEKEAAAAAPSAAPALPLPTKAAEMPPAGLYAATLLAQLDVA